MRVTVRNAFMETFRYQYDEPKILNWGHVQEEKYPWRYGIGRLIRMPFTRRVVAVGTWDGSHAEDDEDGPLVSMRAMQWEELADAAEKARSAGSADHGS